MTIRTLLSILLMLTWLATAAVVAADCELAGPLEEVVPAAPVAFVGTVVATQGPVATFAVREVWAGNVGESVQVRGLSDDLGGPDTGFGAGFSEDDRRWTEGTTYLVLPFIDGGALRDHVCTATTEWNAGLEALRPAGARIVAASEPDGAIPIDLIVIGVVAVVVAGASVLAFRRR